MSNRQPGYKVRNIMQYTEVVYYDADGQELGREEIHDCHTYDSLGAEPLTDDEVSDWGLGGDDE